MIQNADRLHHLAVIIKRLADPHKHYIVRALSQQARHFHHFTDDFTGRQIADNPLLAAGTKCTAVDTADRIGAAFRRGNNHRFDHFPVGQLEEKLLRISPLAAHLQFFQCMEAEMIVEQIAQWRRQIFHFVERRNQLAIKPVENLFGPERRLTVLFTERLQLLRQ